VKNDAKLPATAVTTKIAHASSATSTTFPAAVTGFLNEGYGQELYEGEEERIAEAVYIAALLPVFEDKDQDRAHGCDRQGQAERDEETSEEAPMPLFHRKESTKLFAYHQASLAAPADGAVSARPPVTFPNTRAGERLAVVGQES
jgi:hypothetical protein